MINNDIIIIIFANLGKKVVSSPKSPSKKKNDKNNFGTISLVVNGKAIVDPEAELDGEQVLEENGSVFSVTLTETNIALNTNKYYIMQVRKMNSTKWTFKLKLLLLDNKATIWSKSYFLEKMGKSRNKYRSTFIKIHS